VHLLCDDANAAHKGVDFNDSLTGECDTGSPGSSGASPYPAPGSPILGTLLGFSTDLRAMLLSLLIFC
jgi:hypothetical protein